MHVVCHHTACLHCISHGHCCYCTFFLPRMCLLQAWPTRHEPCWICAWFKDMKGRCALLDLLSEESQEYMRLHHDFRLLDTVFEHFLETNSHQGHCWTFEEMLSIKSSHPGKEFGYTSSGVPYASFVWRAEDCVRSVVTLKLHNDDFKYISKPGQRIYRWVTFPVEDLRKHIPAILAPVVPIYTKVAVWYNFYLAKVDLHFTVPEDAEVPDLTIGFERGKPAYEHQIKAHNLRV